ncbi:MAG: DUF2486 family protein [Roseivirga sp.]
MQAERLIKLLQKPHEITSEDVTDLQNLLQQCPSFQAAYALIAKAAYDKDQPSVGQEVQTAAIYATDRAHLKALLEDAPPFSAPEPIPTPAAPVLAAPAPPVEAYDFINGYISTISQRAERKITKKESLDQLNIIQAFIQKDARFKPQSTQKMPMEASQADLTQESTTFHDDLATESLAQVLVQQGKVQRALAVYNQLMLKFPEKRTYFATLIEELKSVI